MQWAGSAHDRARVSCASCHSVHAERDQVTVKQTQAGVCFTCHKDQRAAMFRYSSHPLRTGSMACSSCHAPHGSVSDYSLVRNTVNETCYSCHADKRGPFLWEHAPVAEECTVCHVPHGSSRPVLLTKTPPLLCQQCHTVAGHPSIAYTSTGLPGGGGGGAAFLLAGASPGSYGIGEDAVDGVLPDPPPRPPGE